MVGWRVAQGEWLQEVGGDRVGGERVGGAAYGGGTDEHVEEHTPAADKGGEEPPAQQNAHRQLEICKRDPPPDGLQVAERA